MQRQTDRQKHVWRIPWLVAVLIAGGLLSALLGTGVWRILSWVLLGIPVIVLLYCIFRPRQIVK